MSNCESPSAFTQTERRARKDHRCCECRGTIKAGERYRYISGIWGGEPNDFKQCQDCIHMRCEMDKHMDSDSWGCDGIPLGGMLDELAEWDRERYWHLCAMFNAYAAERGSKSKIRPPGWRAHWLWRSYDKDAPASLKDDTGAIVLALCRHCGRTEAELDESCTGPTT